MMCVLMLSLVGCEFGEAGAQDGNTKTEKSEDEKDKKKDNNKDKDKDKDKEPDEDPIDDTYTGEYPVIDYNLEHLDLFTNTITDYGYSDDYSEEYVRCRYNTVYTGETVGVKYSALTDEFMALSMDRREGADDYIATAVQDVKDFIETSGDYAIYPYYDETYQDIMRSDERVVSLSYYNEMYMGGAHGMYGWSGGNYDPVLGEKITISDVILDIDSFNTVLKSKLLEYDGSLEDATIDTNLESYKTRLENGEGDYNWSIDYSGITVYFNPYEMGSFAQGAQRIRIKYEEYPELFNDYYAVTPGAYVLGGDPLQGVYSDIDNDGEEEEIYVSVSYADDLYTMDVTIGVGDEAYELQIPGYNLQSYIFHYGDGSEYMMLSADGMSGSFQTMILSFADGDMAVTDISDAGVKYITLTADPDKYSYARIVPSDPYNFLLGTRVDILGTFTGTNWYYIDEYGCLESYSSLYTVFADNDLVLKSELCLYEVESNETITGDTCIAGPGDVLIIAGSDGATCMDVWYDSKLYRIFVDVDDDGNQTIDGESIFDIFEVVYFAG